MKIEVLLELAARWERDAKSFEVSQASDGDSRYLEGISKGEVNAKRECAEDLRSLIKILE